MKLTWFWMGSAQEATHTHTQRFRTVVSEPHPTEPQVLMNHCVSKHKERLMASLNHQRV